MPRETTEVRIDEKGDETHESWLLISAGRVTSTPGAALFDSELRHQHYVSVKVTRCTRQRSLNRDWLYGCETLLEMSMSMAQWGAFVSSFNTTGVPATLEYLTGVGPVPQAPHAPRFEHSLNEVRNAGDKALAQVQESYAQVMEAFENGGKKAQREALRSMGHTLNNVPRNLEFVAESMTEHVENVVTKAKADIEAMALEANPQLGTQTSKKLLEGYG
jgi:hypothetical protein